MEIIIIVFRPALGYSRGLAKRAPHARFGYIQIDGHLDFSDRLGAWGSHNHATNARRISELPNIDVSNMVWVGIAGWVDGGDLALIEKQGGRYFLRLMCTNWARQRLCAKPLQHAMQGCEELYLSIDIDAMDAGYLPGTGSIVHSGITPRQYYDLLDGLAEAPLGGLDIVEVSPPLDPSERTEFSGGRNAVSDIAPLPNSIGDRAMMEYIGTRTVGWAITCRTGPCSGNPALDHGSCSTLSLRGSATW